LLEIYPMSSLMTGAMFGSIKAFTANWHVIQHFAAVVVKRSKNWMCKWCEHESFQFHLPILLSLSPYRCLWGLIWLYCAGDRLSVAGSQQVKHSALCHVSAVE
jgi:hypothetical protein